VYDIQSSITHAADSYRFVGYDPATNAFQLDLAPKSDDVGQVLHVTSGLFIGILNILNTQLHLGFDAQVNAAIERLRDAGRRRRSAP